MIDKKEHYDLVTNIFNDSDEDEYEDAPIQIQLHQKPEVKKDTDEVA